VHALRHHLRETSPFDTLASILPSDEVDGVRGDENVPLALLQRIGELFVEARRKEWIDPLHVAVIEASLTSLTDIQGACERIKSTPMPYSYTVLMHRIVAGYCVLLPFGLMETIKWATPVVVLAISYCFFGLDAIGDEIEQPFGFDTNDLPLDGISNTIERNLRKRIGDPLPPKHEAKRGVLT
jgi:putative membrane protein